MKKCLILSLSIHAIIFAIVSFLVCPWLDKKSHNVRATILLDEASPIDSATASDTTAANTIASSAVTPAATVRSQSLNNSAPRAVAESSAVVNTLTEAAPTEHTEVDVTATDLAPSSALSTPLQYTDFDGQEKSGQLGGYTRAVQQAGLGNEPPVYPRLSRLRGESGRVVIEVVLRSSGEIESIFVAQSSGFEMLDQSALRAVKRWKFPAFSITTKNSVGAAQLIRIRIPILFDLESLD